jgi:hypothetical protein
VPRHGALLNRRRTGPGRQGGGDISFRTHPRAVVHVVQGIHSITFRAPGSSGGGQAIWRRRATPPNFVLACRRAA